MSKSQLRTGVSRCCFTFSDGRRCRTPSAGHPQLCFFHAEREAKARAAAQVGRDVAAAFSGDYVSAIGLSVALARTIAATAQGHFGPKTASAIARLGQTLMRAIEHAQYEYCESRGPGEWRRAVRSTCAPPDDGPDSAPGGPASPPSAPESAAADAADVEKETTTEAVTGATRSTMCDVRPAASDRPTRRQPLPEDATAFATQILASVFSGDRHPGSFQDPGAEGAPGAPGI
jgi:hypothetical protein